MTPRTLYYITNYPRTNDTQLDDLCADLEEWGTLCARGFSSRPGDPWRFILRYRADPTATMQNIRVVRKDSNGPLLGGARVVQRILELNGAPVRFAGVGDVCTDPDARGMGVANVILQDIVALCERTATLALLHAAPGVAGLYARYGFQGIINISYGKMRIRDGAAFEIAEKCNARLSAVSLRVRPASLCDDWKHMAALRDEFMAAIGITAYVRREPEEGYWTRWLHAVAGGDRYAALVADDGTLVGYAAIIARAEGLKLGDFAVRPGIVSVDTARAFLVSALLAAVVASTAVAVQAVEGSSANTTIPPTAAVIVPSAILRWLSVGGSEDDTFQLVTGESFDDKGWMLRTADDNLCAALRSAADAGRLLIFLVDAF